MIGASAVPKVRNWHPDRLRDYDVHKAIEESAAEPSRSIASQVIPTKPTDATIRRIR